MTCVSMPFRLVQIYIYICIYVCIYICVCVGVYLGLYLSVTPLLLYSTCGPNSTLAAWSPVSL